MTFLTFTIIDEEQKVQLEEKEKIIYKLEENSKGIYTSNRKSHYSTFNIVLEMVFKQNKNTLLDNKPFQHVIPTGACYCFCHTRLFV